MVNIIHDPKLTKARKDHKCMFCGKMINKGEKYLRSVHNDNGIFDLKTHTYCDEIANKSGMYDACDDGLDMDAFRECIFYDYQEILSKSGVDTDSRDACNDSFTDQLNIVLKHYGISKNL